MVKNLPGNAGDLDSMPGLGWSPGDGEFWPGGLHGQRSLVGYSLQDCKESDMTERLTHSEEVLGAQKLVLDSWAICKPNEPSSQGQVPFLHAPGALSSEQ